MHIHMQFHGLLYLMGAATEFIRHMIWWPSSGLAAHRQRVHAAASV